MAVRVELCNKIQRNHRFAMINTVSKSVRAFEMQAIFPQNSLIVHVWSHKKLTWFSTLPEVCFQKLGWRFGDLGIQLRYLEEQWPLDEHWQELLQQNTGRVLPCHRHWSRDDIRQTVHWSDHLERKMETRFLGKDLEGMEWICWTWYMYFR